MFFGGLSLSLTFVYWAFQDSIYRGTTGVILASGDLKKWTIATSLEAILNIGCTLWFINMLGLFGVALGTAVAKTLTTAWYTPYLICKKIDLSINKFIVSGIIRSVVYSLPACFLMYASSLLLPGSWGWGRLIALGIIGGGCNILTFEGKLFYNQLMQRFKPKC